MSFKKLKIFLGIAIIVFLIISTEIIVFGLLSQPKDLPTQNLTVINESIITNDTKKNITVGNVVDNSTKVITPTPTPAPKPPVTRAS